MQTSLERVEVMLAELFSILNNISTKLDLLSPQAVSAVEVATVEPVKATGTKKKPVKTSRSKSGKKRTALPNKMQYFNLMFDEDEDYFSAYITEDVKEELEEEHRDEWEGLEGTQLHNAKRKVYYKYMKEHHDKNLQSMKSEYHDQLKAKKASYNDKETSEL